MAADRHRYIPASPYLCLFVPARRLTGQHQNGTCSTYAKSKNCRIDRQLRHAGLQDLTFVLISVLIWVVDLVLTEREGAGEKDTQSQYRHTAIDR